MSEPIEVAGLVALRTNKTTQETEVLLVKGVDGIWYFPGGQREAWDETVYDTLTREVFEELGIHYNQEAEEITTKLYRIGEKTYLIHTFLSPAEVDTASASVDKDEVVSSFEWTATPFTHVNGTQRKLTEHAQEILSEYFPTP